jgi:hypothetical protein
MAGQNHAASEPRLGIYLAKSRFLSQVLNYQVACHGSLWRFWLRGISADEHRKCDEGLDGTFHLCHIFRREAPARAMLHAFMLWLTRLRLRLRKKIGNESFFTC